MTENSFPKTDSEMTDADKVGMSNCELDIQSEKSLKVYFKQIMEYLCLTCFKRPSTVARGLSRMIQKTTTDNCELHRSSNVIIRSCIVD